MNLSVSNPSAVSVPMSAILFRRDDSLGFRRFATFSNVATRNLGGLPHYDLIAFIALAQELQVDFHAFTWNEAPLFPSLGEGGSGRINQATASLSFEYAFKRFEPVPGRINEVYQALFAEIIILQSPGIRDHPNIIDLFGICWEVHIDGVESVETVLPVLVFQKSAYGSLRTFQDLDNLDFNSRVSLCCDIGKALATLHCSSEYFSVPTQRA